MMSARLDLLSLPTTTTKLPLISGLALRPSTYTLSWPVGAAHTAAPTHWQRAASCCKPLPCEHSQGIRVMQGQETKVLRWLGCEWRGCFLLHKCIQVGAKRSRLTRVANNNKCQQCLCPATAVLSMAALQARTEAGVGFGMCK